MATLSVREAVGDVGENIAPSCAKGNADFCELEGGHGDAVPPKAIAFA